MKVRKYSSKYFVHKFNVASCYRSCRNLMLLPVIGHLVIAEVNQEIEIEIIDEKGAMSIGGLTRIGVRD